MTLLSSRQAAARLGVKQQTLYAYVSRGLLTSHRSADGRVSVFDGAEVERLARRGRPRASSRSNTFDLHIATAITSTANHRVRYRGHDAALLASTATFEQVAELLWTGDLPAQSPDWRGVAVPASGDTAIARLRAAAALAGARADVNDRLQPADVAAQGRWLVATMVDSLPSLGDPRVPRLQLETAIGTRVCRGSIAGRLWVRLSPRRATPAALRALNGALVMLADHELAASTLAARVAASTRAGPHAVVACGLGAVSGRYHGGESFRVRQLIAEAEVDGVAAALDRVLECQGRVPGFGQVIYPEGDPRAPVLRALVDMAWPESVGLRLIDELAAAARLRGAPPPSIDWALASLGVAAQMPADAGECIFAVARIAGWLAHAMEEYGERPLRFRPRSTYIGP
jgi:citrate synthase